MKSFIVDCIVIVDFEDCFPHHGKGRLSGSSFPLIMALFPELPVLLPVLLPTLVATATLLSSL